MTSIEINQHQSKKFKLDTSNFTPSFHNIKVEPVAAADIDDEGFALQAIESKSKHNAEILNESKVAATKTLTKTNPKKTNLTKPTAKPTVNTNAHNKPKQYN